MNVLRKKNINLWWKLR